jgi:hypothetical protein
MKDRIIGGVFIALSMLLISACSSIETPMDDGYQFGDVTKTTYLGAKRLVHARYVYCTAAEGSEARATALGVIHTLRPGYPEDGICTNLLHSLVEKYEIDVTEPLIPAKKDGSDSETPATPSTGSE